MKISGNELKVLNALFQARTNNQLRPSGIPNPDTISVERRSDRSYDLGFTYTSKEGYGVAGWLVLACIDDLTQWWKNPIADMTDYPTMAREGDWSGVRDTDDEKLWVIFEKCVLPKILS